MNGSVYPSSHSDIQCGDCQLYFRLDGDLIAHREEDHVATKKSTSIMRGVLSGGQFEPTSGWEML